MLAKVPGLRVAARTSAFYFKGKNATAQEIGQKLGVAHLVDGSVRQAGTKVRIAARLSKADTGEQVWSDSYEEELKDSFALQDKIAKNILLAVKGSLLGEAELPRAMPTKIEAYTLFLRAQAAFAKRGESNLRDAIRLFESALAIDPSYVPALVGLAQTRSVLPLYANLSGSKVREMIEGATQAARRALEIDARNAGAHAVVGWVLVQYEWRWSVGLAAVLRARELAPNDSWIWNSLGDSDQAADWLRLAYDQRDPAIVWNEFIDFNVIAANPATRLLLDQPGLKELHELRQRNARTGGNKL